MNLMTIGESEMKESELRKHTICAICGNKILSTGLPMFWKVTIERFGVDIAAVNRQRGLTMMFGGSASLAMAVGSDEDMARPICEAVEIAVCETCCIKDVCVARLAEIGTD